jgi:hypothetical protein
MLSIPARQNWCTLAKIALVRWTYVPAVERSTGGEIADASNSGGQPRVAVLLYPLAAAVAQDLDEAEEVEEVELQVVARSASPS